MKRIFFTILVILIVMPLAVAEDCGELFERFKSENATCCSGLELQKLPPDPITKEIEYRCIKNATLREQEEQQAFAQYMIFAGLQLLIWIGIMLCFFLALLRYVELYKKETGKDIKLFYNLSLGFTLLSHLFRNNYKSDRYYNTLVWIIRIGLILFFIRFFIAVFFD